METYRSLTVFLLFLSVISACPTSCSCKWKSGKQTASCTEKSLTEIPANLDPTTQVLNFTGNRLSHLPDLLFATAHLPNLQRIYLPLCHIAHIADHPFLGLTNLVELDLSHNLLSSTPTTSFIDCPSLMRLSLAANPIRILPPLAFGPLSYLATLDLTGCELAHIDPAAFRGLHSLERLHLAANRLRTLSFVLPLHLKGVELAGNSWDCNCHLVPLHSWLNNFTVPLPEQPLCSEPQRLVNRPIKALTVDALACLPTVTPTRLQLELQEGRNLTLQCEVSAVPEAVISWWFQAENITKLVSSFASIENGTEHKRSELLIQSATIEVNGTFICRAENEAGTSQANFTIRVIVKETPIVVIVALPIEYLLGAAIGVGVVLLVLLLLIIGAIVRCGRRRRSKLEAKRSKAKEVVETLVRAKEEVQVEGEALGVEAVPCCAVEPNPDLIDGMERFRDVRWVDSEGYPRDYGLPRPLGYRTLPLRRRAASPRRRRAQEVEFLVRGAVGPVERYDANVRYTVDGYPEVVAPLSLPCCSAQWPVWRFVEGRPGWRCVGAQTDGSVVDGGKTEHRGELGLTESPDEGYEGEPAIV